ncbi:hypothetical protein CEUSTIGMA_g6896.t1 [Chlamydomonas eustigma]|uniref:Uncharacterized protein n=1 Tax=Chlamydomonas eustigma TaxID=1157962 RepID=A0A250X8Q4_9CHLO|nr:hypothetical protein CEUSTIGMA_g6896.t1 [Chlamydomonas eustigma]|eukprot:GAX79455.1 hypothetical protein CEUSTIGMA_g6896.t1 [Chlamydomonas eustigma]
MRELETLRAAQGDGKHLRVPARTRILEDWLLQSLQSQPSDVTEIQVVSLGSGLDTRPWRLDFPENLKVHWICMDFPDVMDSKKALLRKAGAQCIPRDSPHFMNDCKNSKWPLKLSSWNGLGLDLSSISNRESVEEAARVLEESLIHHTSFDKSLPTVWILEAVLYYMPLPSAEVLLGALACLSRAAITGTLIATCIDTELLEASRKMDAGHIFAQLWYFDCNELLSSKQYISNWNTRREPKTTKDLAKELYNSDTYVALYGGAECAFIADLKQNSK